LKISSLFKKTFLLLSIRAFGLSITFLIALFIAREYGADATGLYYLFISTLTGLSIIARFGLERTLIKYVSQFDNTTEKHKIIGLWKKSINISLIVSISLILLLQTLAHINLLTDQLIKNKQVINDISISLVPLTIFFLTAATFRGLNKLILANILETVFLPLVFFILIIIYSNFKLVNFITASYTTATIIIAILSIILIFNYFKRNKENTNYNHKSLIKTSLPILAINLTNFISDWGATIIMSSSQSLESIGVFNICLRLTSILSIIMLVFSNILSPIYSREHAKGNTGYIDNLSRNSSFLLNLIGMPIIVVFFMFPKEILSIFGDEFINGAQALQILVISQLFNFLSGSSGYLLLMTGHQRRLMTITIFVSITQLIGFIIFIPSHGILGASVIILFSVFTRSSLSIYLCYKHLNVLTLPLPINLFKKV